MTKSLIVAVAKNGVIGVKQGLPWRIPDDLRRFKRMTMGHHVIMGRKTYDSVGHPLPGRTNIVLTRGDFSAKGVIVARTLDEAYAHAKDDDEPFVIGGAALFAAALPTADRVYLTAIDRAYEGDTYWPGLDARWQRASVEEHADFDPPFRYELWTPIG